MFAGATPAAGVDSAPVPMIGAGALAMTLRADLFGTVPFFTTSAPYSSANRKWWGQNSAPLVSMTTRQRCPFRRLASHCP
jgi:hypothetical protein